MVKASTKVLDSLDKAKTQSYHFKAVIISGMGFFTDAYDLFSISTVTRLMGRLYYPSTGAKPGVLPANVNAAVVGVALCGTLVGQLFFGWAGDKWGRKKVYGITLMIMVLASIASGLSLGSTPTSVMTTLCFFRFWLGFGIGGDYPLSATIMSEYSNKKNRGAFVAAVFAMQGLGILVAAAVSIVVSAAFRAAYPAPDFDTDKILSTPPQSDFVWRIVLMFGAIPAALTFYSRSKMPETARYTALVEQNQEKARMDMEKVLHQQFDSREDIEAGEKDKPYGLFSAQFLRRHGRELLGTTTCWFFLDVAFYSQNLFQKDIFTAVGWLPAAGTMSALEETFRVSKAQALIALVSTVPGYWFSVALIDIMGRKAIQLMGFFFMTLFMFILTFDYYNLRGVHCGSKFCGGNHIAFIVLYAFTFFFSNFGPNTTTFIVPAELFPARLRSTCHGISSAAGKAGAIVGAFGFLYASQSQSTPDAGYPKGIGIKNSLLVLAITNCLGFLFTFLIPETKGKSLEDLSGENDPPAGADNTQNRSVSLSNRIGAGDGADGMAHRNGNTPV